MQPSKKSKSNPTVIPFISITHTSNTHTSNNNTLNNNTLNTNKSNTNTSDTSAPASLYNTAGKFAPVSSSSSSSTESSNNDRYLIDRTTVHHMTVNPLSGLSEPYQPIKSVIGNKRTFTETKETPDSSIYNFNQNMFSQLNLPVDQVDPNATRWKQNKIILHLHNDTEIKYNNETIVLASKSVLSFQFKKLEQELTSPIYIFEGSEEQKQLFVRMLCTANLLSKAEFTGMSLTNYDLIKFMNHYGMNKSLYDEFIKLCIGYELGIPKKVIIDPIHGSDNGILNFNLLNITCHDTDNLSIARQLGSVVTEDMLCMYFAVKLHILANAARLFDRLEDVFSFKLMKIYIMYVQATLLAKKLLKKTMFLVRTYSNNYVNGLLSTVALGVIDY